MNWLCKWGWHKFRARYNEKPSGYNIKSKEVRAEIDELRSMLVIKEYAYDICERCGKVIK